MDIDDNRIDKGIKLRHLEANVVKEQENKYGNDMLRCILIKER